MKEKLHLRKKADLPMIFQEEMAECGHACIAMVTQYFGKNLDLPGLRAIQTPSIRGQSLLDLVKLLESLHFRTRALKLPFSELAQVPCPAIIHWNSNHFVVLKKVTRKKVIIHDPAVGLRCYDYQEAAAGFSGVVLEIQQSSALTLPAKKQNPGLLDWIQGSQGIKSSMIILLALSLSLEMLSLINPLFMQYVTDEVIASSSTGNLYAISLGFMLLFFFQMMIYYLRGQLVIFLTNSLTEQFASNIMQHILKLPLGFFEKRHKGDILSKFNSIDRIQKKISTDFVNTLLDGFMIVITLIVMTIYSVLLSSLFLTAIGIYFLIRYFSYQNLKNQMEKSVVHHARTASIFLESLQGMLPIKAWQKENRYFSLWRNHYISALNADIKVSRMQLYFNLLHQTLGQTEYLLTVALGAALTLSHQFTLGLLLAFLSWRQIVASRFMVFIQNIFDFKLLSIELHRLNDILLQEPEKMIETPLFRSLETISLSVQHLDFSYDPLGLKILNNLNLEIAAGEKVVITGSSGCGKSTLLKIMMGLLAKTSGDLQINGIRLEDFGLKNYRRLTASVLQEDTLLSGSIRDNITFFDEQSDPDKLFAATKLACIHETIGRFPMGYETLVGDMGSTLSGGQKQRILLARALYKQPKLLFLDEATSHLDVDTEIKINQALKQLNITQIIIAHRKETIEMADRVIDLEALNGG